MQVSVIVSVVGKDRPGLVERLSRVVADAGGNWEASRMVRLGGQFAGMVQIVAPESRFENLRAGLATLEEEDLGVSVVHSEKMGDADTEVEHGFFLDVVGQDRPGIVSAISEILAEEGVNVIELVTDCRPAPWSGERIFQSSASLAIPESVRVDRLRQRLEDFGGDLMVEFRPLPESVGREPVPSF